jgi:hypothetical protein
MSEQIVLQELKEKIKKKEKKTRTFAGFIAELKFSDENLTLNIPIRYAKMDLKEIDKALKIIAKSKTTGKEVQYKYIGETRRAWIDIEGREYPKEDIEYYQELDNGELITVSEFQRTKIIEIIKLVPLNKLDEYLIESEYELWTDKNIVGLLRFAKYLSEKDSMAVSKITFGGFKEYYALIYPIFRQEGFVLVMALTRMNKIYKHIMSIKVEEKKEIAKPTVKSVLKLDI